MELLVSAEHKHDFVARDRTDNLLTSVDSVVHKVEQQLKKYKSKLQDRRSPGGARVAQERPASPEESSAEDDSVL